MPLGGVSLILQSEPTPQMRDRAGHSAALRGGPDRARVLGCEIDRVDLAQAVTVCQQVIENHAGTAEHAAINVAKLIAMRDDALLRDSVSRCELITADGQPVVWASRLLRDPLPQRVAGIDLMQSLLTLAAAQGYRVYVLGARQTCSSAPSHGSVTCIRNLKSSASTTVITTSRTSTQSRRILRLHARTCSLWP